MRSPTPASPLRIGPDSPLAEDVGRLLHAHLALMRASSPPEDVHALDVDGLLRTAFVSARSDDGALLAVGALLPLEPGHVEVKSMHTTAQARGRGVARAVLRHLLDLAVAQGARRVSLETGSQDVFLPARRLYLSEGFAECPPFGDYAPSVHSAFLTRALP